MPTLSPLKKTLIASAFITPLVLGACSSEAEETTEAQNGAAAAASDDSAAKQGGTGSGAEVEDDAAEEGADQAGSATAGSDAAAPTAEGDSIDPAADPLDLEQLTFAELSPVEGGQPADETDQAEIESLITGMYETTTLHEILLYVPQNACQDVIQEAGGEAAFDLGGIPDMPLDAIPQYSNSNSQVDAVEDVQVDGATASATVTATSDGQSLTEVQRFRHEDGAWKFCN